MFEYQDVFHVGVRVRDIEQAMEDLGTGLGITWCEVMHRDQKVWTPENGEGTLPLTFTYSAEGPQHVELLQGPAGSVWDGNDYPGVHHHGVWMDDVGAETERLVGLGWQLEAAQLPPDQGYGSFSYVRSPSGFLLEPVTSAARPMFDRWFAGGTLG